MRPGCGPLRPWPAAGPLSSGRHPALRARHQARLAPPGRRAAPIGARHCGTAPLAHGFRHRGDRHLGGRSADSAPTTPRARRAYRGRSSAATETLGRGAKGGICGPAGRALAAWRIRAPTASSRQGPAGLGAAGLGRAIDHDLRRIDLAHAKRLGIGPLAFGEGGLGEGVAPAQIVPVVDWERSGRAPPSCARPVRRSGRWPLCRPSSPGW